MLNQNSLTLLSTLFIVLRRFYCFEKVLLFSYWALRLQSARVKLIRAAPPPCIRSTQADLTCYPLLPPLAEMVCGPPSA